MNEITICQNCNRIVTSKDTNTCIMCGKRICQQCTRYDYQERMRTNYPDPYCSPSWDIGKPYRIEINKVELNADMEKEGIISDWYDEINGVKLEQIAPLIGGCHRYEISCKHGTIKYHVLNTHSDADLMYYHADAKKTLYEKYID